MGLSLEELEALGQYGTITFRDIFPWASPVRDVGEFFSPGFGDYLDTYKNVQGWRNTSVKFFDDHWLFFLLSVVLYPPVVYGLLVWMRDRKPFDLRVPLILWNWLMASFSLLGTLYVIPLAIYGFSNATWFGNICTRWCYSQADGEFLVFLFDVSKVFEFVDTLFIVLRKKPLIFLHYYHHVVTMLFCWYCNQTSQEVGCHGYYFSAMNFIVHFIMYSYYAVMAMRIRIPAIFSTFITILQIAQMIVGVAIVITLAYCDPTDMMTVYFGSALYLSFFLLFAHFFYRRYIAKKPRQPQAGGDGDKPKNE